MSDNKKRAAKGEGSFKKIPNGYKYRLSVGNNTNGKRKVLTVSAPTKSACIKLMRSKLAEWEKLKNLNVTGRKDSVTELCMNHLKASEKEIKPKSYDRRECTIINQVQKYDIGNFCIDSVTPLDIENHINLLIHEGKISESSIKKALDVLNAAFNWAVLQDILEKNPVEPVKEKLSKKLRQIGRRRDANDPDVNVLSPREQEIFEREASRTKANGRPYYVAGDILLLLMYTGCRVGEIIPMTWSKVDLKNGIMTIDTNASMIKNRKKTNENEANFIMHEGSTKNEKTRIIQLMPQAKQILMRMYLEAENKGPNDLIAPTSTGRMQTTSNLEHRLDVIMKNAGLDVKGGCHVLRRSFATARYHRDNWRLEELAAYLGDIEYTIQRYYLSMQHKEVHDGKVMRVIKIPTTNDETAS